MPTNLAARLAALREHADNRDRWLQAVDAPIVLALVAVAELAWNSRTNQCVACDEVAAPECLLCRRLHELDATLGAGDE